MHTTYIDQRDILSLHINSLDFRQSALSFMIESNNDWSTFKVWSLQPCKAINVYAHHDDLWIFAQLAISIADRRKGLTSDHTHDERTNAYKSARGFWLTSLTIILFTRVAPRIKSKWAPDQRSTNLILLSARASPCIKIRGSIGICSKFIILLIKFSKVFTAQ
jgi:hypothetical protein